jgi:LysM repeat protein
VQSGDTLFSLARVSGSTVSDIRAGNCLADETIFVQQTLYLPLPGTTLASTDISIEGCNAPGVSLDPTLVGRIVSGVFEVRGTANIENFSYYRLEVLPPGASSYVEVRRGAQRVVDSVLARINTGRFAPGVYRLRLVVVDARGAFPQPCDIPLIIE